MKYLNDAGGRFTLPLKDDAGKTLCTLLLGDPLQEIAREGDRVKVRAPRRTGWLPASAVGDSGLLEIYVIDVGQGDGVLMRTPHDDAWHIIDAGIRASEQMTRKGAANFVRWKFIDDLQLDRVHFANMIVSHPDADHYGGSSTCWPGSCRMAAASRSRSIASGHFVRRQRGLRPPAAAHPGRQRALRPRFARRGRRADAAAAVFHRTGTIGGPGFRVARPHRGDTASTSSPNRSRPSSPTRRSATTAACPGCRSPLTWSMAWSTCAATASAFFARP